MNKQNFLSLCSNFTSHIEFFSTYSYYIPINIQFQLKSLAKIPEESKLRYKVQPTGSL